MKRKPEERDLFVFFVRNLEGKSMTIEGSQEDQVWTVLTTLVERNLVSEAASRNLGLVYKGKCLDPNKTLGESGVGNMSTIHVVGRLPSISCNSTAYRWLKHVQIISECASLDDAYNATLKLVSNIAKQEGIDDTQCVELSSLNFVQAMSKAVRKMAWPSATGRRSLIVTTEKLESAGFGIPLTISRLCNKTITNREHELRSTTNYSGSRQFQLQLEIALTCMSSPCTNDAGLMNELANLALSSVASFRRPGAPDVIPSPDLAECAQQALMGMLTASLPHIVALMDVQYWFTPLPFPKGLCKFFAALGLLYYYTPVPTRAATAIHRVQLVRSALQLANNLGAVFELFDGVPAESQRHMLVHQHLIRCSHMVMLLIGLHCVLAGETGQCGQCGAVSEQLRRKVQELMQWPGLHHACAHVEDGCLAACSAAVFQDPVMMQSVPSSFRVSCLRGLHSYYDNEFITRQIMPSRTDVLESSFSQLMAVSARDMTNYLQVQFVTEEGEGIGVTREWLGSVAVPLFHPDRGLFMRCPHNPRAIHPSHLAAVHPTHLKYCEFAGRILGLALLNSVPLGFYLSEAFFVSLSSATPEFTLEHLAEVAPEKATSYRALLNQEGVEQMGLTFTTSYDTLGGYVERPLLPHGNSDQVVTDDNKQEFVRMMINDELYGRVKQEVNDFALGLFSVFSGRNICYLFTLHALNQLIGGRDDIIVSQWRDATLVKSRMAAQGGKEPPVIEWFWEIVSGMTHQEHKQLLHFWTALKSLPVGGFTCLAHRPELHIEEYSRPRLPRAHTCFGQLSLPEYPTKKDLEAALQVVLDNSEGYGMV